MRINTLNGFVETKTDLTQWEMVEVAKMMSNGVCTSCIENWLLKRDFIITKSENRLKNLTMHIIDVLPNK